MGRDIAPDATVTEWVVASIRKVLSDEPFGEAEWKLQPANGWDVIETKSRFGVVRSDRDPAHYAVIALRQWIDDEDIRTRDAEYAASRRRMLAELLQRIEAGS